MNENSLQYIARPGKKPARSSIIDQPYRNKEWLEDHYISKRMSASAIAKELHTTHHTVLAWLKRFGIPVRDRGLASHLARANHFKMDDTLLEFLAGELLGDGAIVIKGGERPGAYRSGVYVHSTKYYEYAVWLAHEFATFDIAVSTISKTRTTLNGKVYTGWIYQTKTYAEFAHVRKRWYPNGKKIIPANTLITPLIMRQWYIEDGCLHKPKDARPNISIAAMDFSFGEREGIVQQLNALGLAATNRPSGSIGILARSVPDFLTWIGTCPTQLWDIYGYKWEI